MIVIKLALITYNLILITMAIPGLGSMIGGGLKVAGGIAGGILSAINNRKIKKNIEQQQRENQDWFDRRYNEDATQRADAQRVLTNLNETIRNRNKQIAGTQAVMGGTEESVAAAKAVNNEAIADATSNIAVASEARKADIENTYLANKSDLNNQLTQLRGQHGAMIQNAVSGIANTAGGVAEALNYDELLGGK